MTTVARARNGTDRQPTLLAAVAGMAAVLLGLGVAELVAWFAAPAGSPLTAVGTAIIELLPASLIDFGKTTLGSADKPVLLILVTVGVLLLGALAGRLEYVRRWLGLIPLGVVTALGWVANALNSPESVLVFLPTLLGTAAGVPALRSLTTRLQEWHSDRSQRATGPGSSRRSFLGATLAIAGLGVVTAAGGRLLSAGARAVEQARTMIRLPAPTTPADPIPAGADFGSDGLTSYVTPNDDFYRIDTALQVPQVDVRDWSLRITGMVEREVTLTYDDLLARPLVEHVATLACVSNEVGGNLAGNARWLGLPIRDLLMEAKPLAGADMVLSESTDGFTAGTPLEVLLEEERQSLVAVGMNGEPLPLEHGFPARLVVPGLYGYVSATKWVTSLTVTTFAEDIGYWTPLGWSALGPIKTASRIDTPQRRATVGEVVVAGVAWAQHSGIERVEVQVDDGAWQEAELAEVTGPDTWRQWRYRWPADQGEHTLTVRATDTTGATQTADTAPPAPDGATGWHSVTVEVTAD